MIPVDQLTLHDPAAGTRGDCIRACLASIVHVDPAEMPNFVDHHGPGAWWDEARRWLRTHTAVDLGEVVSLDDVIEWAPDPWAHAIATVQSPRGPWLHCVVTDRHGVIVHDPHPTGRLAGPAEAVDNWMVLVDPYEPWPSPRADQRDLEGGR